MSGRRPRQPRGPRPAFRPERPAPPRRGRRHRPHRLPRHRPRPPGPRPRHCRRAGTGSGRRGGARLACGEACRGAGASRLAGAWPEPGVRRQPRARGARTQPDQRPALRRGRPRRLPPPSPRPDHLASGLTVPSQTIKSSGITGARGLTEDVPGRASGTATRPPSRPAGRVREVEALQQPGGPPERLRPREVEQTPEHLQVLSPGEDLVDGGELPVRPSISRTTGASLTTSRPNLTQVSAATSSADSGAITLR